MIFDVTDGSDLLCADLDGRSTADHRCSKPTNGRACPAVSWRPEVTADETKEHH